MEMRRKDRMLNQEETIDILNKSEYGVLSTVGKDNAPYGVPINFAYVDGVVYFHCSKAKGYKIINIMNNSNVCLTVVNDVCLQPEILSTKYNERSITLTKEKRARSTYKKIVTRIYGNWNEMHREKY